MQIYLLFMQTYHVKPWYYLLKIFQYIHKVVSVYTYSALLCTNKWASKEDFWHSFSSYWHFTKWQKMDGE